MVQDNCPQGHAEAFKFMECYCGLTGIDANPFAPWPSTTTTTPMPVPAPPVPHPYPRPAPPLPGNPCDLTESCIRSLQSPRTCMKPERNGGHKCYQGLKVWQKQLTGGVHGCPTFFNDSEPIVLSKAFCWCGIDHTVKTQASNVGSYRSSMSLEAPMANACRNRNDELALRHRGSLGVESDLYHCAYDTDGSVDKGAHCMQQKIKLSNACANCYGESIHCTEQHCMEECACSARASRTCERCQQQHCRSPFRACSGLAADAASDMALSLIV